MGGPRRFNPHPPLRADAIHNRAAACWSQHRFNPHPPLRADAIMGVINSGRTPDVSILTRPYGRMLSLNDIALTYNLPFQSSPALTGGCYLRPSESEGVHGGFQSSPALTGGCYLRWARLVRRSRWPFQSSPALTGGCYLCCTCFAKRRMSGFNPHPPLRADAIITTLAAHASGCWFQSSPALTGGCYDVVGQHAVTPKGFQSSPALTGGCYAAFAPA